MRCCARSVQYRSNPGNMTCIMQILLVLLGKYELAATDQESCISALKDLDHELICPKCESSQHDGSTTVV